MNKHKNFSRTRFSAEVLTRAHEKLQAIANSTGGTVSIETLTVEHDDATWNYDSLQEFLADYRKFAKHAHFCITAGGNYVRVWVDRDDSSVTVNAISRESIEDIFYVFEESQLLSKLPDPPPPEEPRITPTVFVGHGRSPQWLELKNHLQDKHHFRVLAYETGARAGHTIRDILDDMLWRSSIALLVMTGEDETTDGAMRARQNVVHEAGLFQGRLGFSRAIVLLEEGVDLFSNVHGIQYIPFSKGRIRESFGDVLATLHREFPGERLEPQSGSFNASRCCGRRLRQVRGSRQHPGAVRDHRRAACCRSRG